MRLAPDWICWYSVRTRLASGAGPGKYPLHYADHLRLGLVEIEVVRTDMRWEMSYIYLPGAPRA
jgi:hypothetical protein